MTTKLTDKNISNVSNLGIQWQSVITADGSTTTTAVAGKGYFIDTTSAAHTINLPTSATAGDTVAIKDYAGTFGTNALTIGRNGHNIQGVANDSQISTNRANVELVYIDSTKGWLYSNESNVAYLGPTFITATGGTVTTSGDFKIHTFTGDGSFVVSQTGSNGGPTAVDYLVVAGGGGGAGNEGGNGGGGAGGAGGFRESHSTCNSGCYTASPLATPTGITVSATTYPVTVGGGGSGSTGPSQSSGSNGSNSVFSTITSAGGGGGGSGWTPIPQANKDGQSGGSGGGSGSDGGGGSGGTGNTPPVSPPQGNAGGDNSTGSRGAGGGGATAVGASTNPSNASSQTGSNGGAGAGTNINSATGESGPGCLQYYSGGGGGGAFDGNSSDGGLGGVGGGGLGAGRNNPPSPGFVNGTAGTANTGGGGGGAGMRPAEPGDGAAGGKGIVIIRYKYQ